MKMIPLTKGMVTIVDDEDYEMLSKFTWSATKNREFWYAKTNAPKGQIPRTIYMHRLILNATKDQRVDHADQNTLDNRRENLRLATRSQNSGNMRMRSYNTSGYKGVHWHKAARKWSVTAQEKYIGLFHSKEEAARAYDEAAVKIWGPFARTNQLIGTLQNA